MRIALCLITGQILLLAACTSPSPMPEGIVLDTSGWIPFELADFGDMEGTALDMSFLLEAPAGQHGFLTVKGDRFIFDDGTEARFWGGNIFGEANFPDSLDAVRISDIIARSGSNIIRMHHLDVVKPWTDKVVQRSFFGGQSPLTTRELDPEMLDRFFFMVHCLKERGVYIFLSHLSSRFIMEGDGFPGGEEGFEDVGQGFKVEGMFDPYLIGLQKEYLRELLTRKNPYTGLSLADDPAMALIEVVNENSLFWIQPDGTFGINSSYYREMLGRMFTTWLQEKYGDTESVVQAWTEEGKEALLGDESLEAGNIGIPHIYVSEKEWPVSEARKRDTYRFLYDIQDDYYREMYDFLRELGLRIPVTGSNHWCDDLADLHLNARLDYVDRHAYFTHPVGEYNYIEGQGVQAEPMVKDPQGGNIGSLARRRVIGLPYTVSEWHNPLPNPYRAEGTPIMAAYSCLQDWHPMHYAYWGSREAEPDTINSFEVMFDPTQMNLIPASALMFHRQDVRPADQVLAELITADNVLYPTAEIDRHAEYAFAFKYGISFEDIPATLVKNHPVPKQQEDGAWLSTTGELSWDAGQGLCVINTPGTQAVIGFSGGMKIDTRDLRFMLETPFSAVVVTSLTDQEIRVSRRILVSTSADARMSGVTMSGDFSRVLRTGSFPFLMQPVEGEILLKVEREPLVYALSPGGKRMKEIDVIQAGEGYLLTMAREHKAMHYEIVTEK